MSSEEHQDAEECDKDKTSETVNLSIFCVVKWQHHLLQTLQLNYEDIFGICVTCKGNIEVLIVK